MKELVKWLIALGLLIIIVTIAYLFSFSEENHKSEEITGNVARMGERIGISTTSKVLIDNKVYNICQGALLREGDEVSIGVTNWDGCHKIISINGEEIR